MAYSNEFKVGLLAILSAAFTAVFIVKTDDRPDGAIDGYDLYADVDSAEGVQSHTPVMIAGVTVGSVSGFELNGTRARLTLEMAGQVELPVDSFAELHGAGVLGDKSVVLIPGTKAELLHDQDVIQTRKSGLDVEALSAKLDVITEDVRAVVASVREILDSEEFKANLEATIQNLKELSEQLKELVGANSSEITEIAGNLRDVSESLDALVTTTGTAVGAQLEAFRSSTDKLNSSLDDLNSITTKIDSGEGTLGYLVNDPTPAHQVETTLTSVNRTLEDVGNLVGSVSDLQTKVYYDGAYLIGTEPDADFGTDPSQGHMRNAVGLEIIPRDDYWYVFEFVDHPSGSFDFRQVENPALGSTYSEYIRTRDMRVSFQFARRFGDLVLRFGIKDSSGGIGADAYVLHDRIRFSADLYDFTYASYPVLDGTPNLKVGVLVEPYPHIWLQGGVYNALVGARYGYVTGYVGGGFHFNDDDFKWILATLPSVP